MSGLCLVGAGFLLALGTGEISLRWEHSVERVEWHETWRREGDRLRLVEAAVRGSGAGMEAGEGARLKEGFYVWNPVARYEPSLILRRSGATADWIICRAGQCGTIEAIASVAPDPVTLLPCP